MLSVGAGCFASWPYTPKLPRYKLTSGSMSGRKGA